MASLVGGQNNPDPEIKKGGVFIAWKYFLPQCFQDIFVFFRMIKRLSNMF